MQTAQQWRTQPQPCRRVQLTVQLGRWWKQRVHEPASVRLSAPTAMRSIIATHLFLLFIS